MARLENITSCSCCVVGRSTQEKSCSSHVCWRLVFFGVARRGLRSIFSESFSLLRMMKQKRLLLDARIVNWAFVSPPGVSFVLPELWLELRCVCLGMWKREVQLRTQPSRASSSVLDWVTSRTVFTATFWTMSSPPILGWTLCSQVSSRFLVPVCWTITLRWTFCGVVFPWDSRGAFSSCN